MRLLKLSPEERDAICEAGLTERHARALLRIPEKTVRLRVLKDIIERKLNVQQTDDMIDELLTVKEEKPKIKRTIIVKDVRIFMNTITHAIETMKHSGIHAAVQKRETEEYIECVVRIPKTEARSLAGGKKPA